MKITREIISDLWPIYAAEEGSPDTQALVKEFLQQDPEFARLLNDRKVEALLNLSTPILPPDHEAKALSQTKRVLYGSNWLFFSAMLFSFLALGRIISDTSWDVSPKPFIIIASIAAGFWIFFFLRRASVRRKVLSRPLRTSR
jgi:hypothetical protein